MWKTPSSKMKPNYNLATTAKKLHALNAFNEKSRVRDKFSMFVSETSFTPLIVIYNSTSFSKRIIWITVVLGFFTWTIVQCYWLLDKYFGYPIEVKLELKAATELEFPSVTICNLNPILHNQLKREEFNDLFQCAEPDTTDLLFKASIRSWTFAEQCSDEKYKCSNGKCIFYTDLCDQQDNCGNNEDEMNCDNRTCRDNYFQCSTGRCIDLTWLCDNRTDCENGEDEYPNNSLCNKSVTSTSIIKQETTETTTYITSTTQPVPTTTTSFTSLNTSSTGAPPKHKRDTHLVEHQVVNKHIRAIKQKIESMNFDLKTELGRQKATEELYKNFKEFMEDVEHEKKLGKSIYKHVRKVRSTNDRDLSRSSSSLNWTDILCNTSFNKWDVLNQNSNMSTNFYKTKDEEYLASMTYSYITAQMDDVTVEKYGHQKYDFIASCKFNNRFCSPENFTFFHNHKYGNCYTFNHISQTETLTTKRPGPIYGLVLELFINQGEYVANLAPEAGARVVLHKRGTMPFPEDEGIVVMPGTSTSIGIKQVVYNRLDPPHGVCGESPLTTDYYAKYKGTTPTKLSCLKSCFQDIMLDRCNCAVPFYYINDNVTVCDINDTKTETCVNQQPKLSQQQYQKCDNLCPLPCKETRYETSSSQALWPGNAYESFLRQRLQQTNALYMKIHDSKDEFIKLQIYFQDMIYQEIEQQKGYESMNLISDLGGQLGLWLGLSAITIGEFCSFLCTICRSLPSLCRSSKTNPTIPTPVTPLQPATLEEMYEDMCPELAKYDPPDIILPSKIKNIKA